MNEDQQYNTSKMVCIQIQNEPINRVLNMKFVATVHAYKLPNNGVGPGVGTIDGAGIGCPLGNGTGASVGFALGASVGFSTGASVEFATGASVGFALGASTGFSIGASVGPGPGISFHLQLMPLLGLQRVRVSLVDFQ